MFRAYNARGIRPIYLLDANFSEYDLELSGPETEEMVNAALRNEDTYPVIPLNLAFECIEWHIPILPDDGTVWSSEGFQHSDYSFIRQPTLCFGEVDRPITYFRKFCNDKMINHMVTQTNLYAEQKGSPIATNKEEIEKFLGLNLLSGIIKSNDTYDLFSRHHPANIFRRTMTLERFEKLRDNFHLNDNTNFTQPHTAEGYDRWYKVRPFVNILKENLEKMRVEEYLYITEVTMPFQDPLRVHGRKNQYHLLFFNMTVMAGASGIVYNFELYDGKRQATRDDKVFNDVLEMAKTIPRTNKHKLIFCEFLLTHKLAVALKEAGVLAMGLVNARSLPMLKDMKDKKDLLAEGRGKFDYRVDKKNNLIVIKWRDRSVVSILSNYAGIHPMGKVERNEGILVDCPAAILELETMRSKRIKAKKRYLNIDLQRYYPCSIKVKRYYLRIVFFMLDICVRNAYILYRQHCKQMSKNPIAFMWFRAHLCASLIKNDPEGELDSDDIDSDPGENPDPLWAYRRLEENDADEENSSD